MPASPYSSSQRRGAVERYYALVAQGLSKSGARRVAAEEWAVNTEALKGWINRGLPLRDQLLDKGGEDGTVIMALRSRVAELEAEVNKLRGKSDSREDSARVDRIVREVWERNYCCYGAVKLYHAIRREGYDISRRRVARAMTQGHMRGFTGGAKRGLVIALIRPVGWPINPLEWGPVGGLAQRLAVDVTTCEMTQGHASVTFVTDLASRKVLAWQAQPIEEPVALKVVVRTAIRDAQMIASRGSVGDPPSTPIGVSLIVDASTGHLPKVEGLNTEAASSVVLHTTAVAFKVEAGRMHDGCWRCVDDVRASVKAWVAWYNTSRLHGEMGNRTPSEVEALLLAGD